MFDSLCLEDISQSMKWGFLSDNIIDIIDKHRSESNELNEKEKEIVKGAIDFFEMVKCGIDNTGKNYFTEGIEKVVKCLTVYNYTSKVFMSEDNKYEDFSKDLTKKRVEKLLKVCQKLYNNERQNGKEIEPLRKFFISLGKFTFKETNSLLENQPSEETTSWKPINALESVL